MITIKQPFLYRTAHNIVLPKSGVEFLIEKLVFFCRKKHFFFLSFAIFTKRKKRFAGFGKVEYFVRKSPLFGNTFSLSVSVKSRPANGTLAFAPHTSQPFSKSQRAVFCQRTDKTVENFMITFYLRK